ncbi:MAG: BlaI/MecI/CopY family transcriptional regulator [Actinomycetota bacterium]|nr:BlaI/MecI/CopY family transcriptional regulator [Actinomycetota bacterium]
MKRFKLGSFRPSESGVRKMLGDLEADIMELVWEKDQASVREIHGLLERDREIAYTTVMTVMSRLAEKNILFQERNGKQYLYKALLSKEEFNEIMFVSVFTGFQEDLGKQALSYFVENISEDTATLDELERLIQHKRRQIEE